MCNSSNVVCIAKDDRYDDSMGAYTVFYMWDGEKVYTEGGMYSNLAYNALEVNATMEQVRAASTWVESNVKESLSDTMIGCVITLKGSRKAPNGVPLKVVGHAPRRYNNRFNTYDSEKICVKVEGIEVWVNASCFDTLVKGVKNLPFWYVSSSDYNNHIENLHEEALNLNKLISDLKEIFTILNGKDFAIKQLLDLNPQVQFYFNK